LGTWNQHFTVTPEQDGPFRVYFAKAITVRTPWRTASFATICEPQAVGA
jgi:hypothetical protein